MGISAARAAATRDVLLSEVTPLNAESQIMKSPLHQLRKNKLIQSMLGKARPAILYRMKELPFKIYIDPLKNTQELFARSYGVESEVTECIVRLLEKKEFSHFLDIGANIGFFSWLVFSKSPLTQLHLFEPDKECFDILKKTSVHLGILDAHLNRCVVSDVAGSKEFYEDNITGKTGSIRLVYGGKNYAEHFFSQPRSVEQVASVTLNAYTEHLSGPFLMKCDIEGAEDLVIDSGAKFITDKRPIMIIEINRNNSALLPERIALLGYTFKPISKKGSLDRDYLFIPTELAGPLAI